MNIHWSSSKKDCTIEEYILELYETTPFHNYNVSHACRNDYQVTFIFMENQENSLINTVKIVFDEHVLVCIFTHFGYRLFNATICIW